MPDFTSRELESKHWLIAFWRRCEFLTALQLCHQCVTALNPSPELLRVKPFSEGLGQLSTIIPNVEASVVCLFLSLFLFLFFVLFCFVLFFLVKFSKILFRGCSTTVLTPTSFVFPKLQLQLSPFLADLCWPCFLGFLAAGSPEKNFEMSEPWKQQRKDFSLHPKMDSLCFCGWRTYLNNKSGIAMPRRWVPVPWHVPSC